MMHLKKGVEMTREQILRAIDREWKEIETIEELKQLLIRVVNRVYGVCPECGHGAMTTGCMEAEKLEEALRRSRDEYKGV